jgi:hypothetical protein
LDSDVLVNRIVFEALMGQRPKVKRSDESIVDDVASHG